MAIKTFLVTAEVNMSADSIKTITVKANTENKAVKYAEDTLKKQGYRNVLILRCSEKENEKC